MTVTTKTQTKIANIIVLATLITVAIHSMLFLGILIGATLQHAKTNSDMRGTTVSEELVNDIRAFFRV